MNVSAENNVSLEHIRSLFYRVSSYRNELTGEMTSKGFLHKWYFDLYETMYANGIKVGSNYFLSIFLQYLKNENSILYQELQKISSHEHAESLNFFIDTQVSIRYLDYLLDHDLSVENIKEEIEGLRDDMDPNNKFSIPTEKEERRIHLEIIKLLESLLIDNDREDKQCFPFNLYLNSLDLDEVKKYIQTFTFDEEQIKICSDDIDIERAKGKILQNINRFNGVFKIDNVQKSSSIRLSKDKSFTKKLFIDAIKKGFMVELFFTCYANESSRSKLKTRAFSDKPKYAKIKEFANVYYVLTKGKKSSLSYIPIMIFGLDTGLNPDTIYKLTNQYYSHGTKSELNRTEFDKNLKIFSEKASARQQLDTYIDTLAEKGFEEIKYTLDSSDEISTDSVYEEFHTFIIYYIISNRMDLKSNNLLLDDKEISIESDHIKEIIKQLREEEQETASDEMLIEEELEIVSDVVPTEEEIERIKKLYL